MNSAGKIHSIVVPLSSIVDFDQFFQIETVSPSVVSHTAPELDLGEEKCKFGNENHSPNETEEETRPNEAQEDVPEQHDHKSLLGTNTTVGITSSTTSFASTAFCSKHPDSCASNYSQNNPTNHNNNDGGAGAIDGHNCGGPDEAEKVTDSHVPNTNIGVSNGENGPSPVPKKGPNNSDSEETTESHNLESAPQHEMEAIFILPTLDGGGGFHSQPLLSYLETQLEKSQTSSRQASSRQEETRKPLKHLRYTLLGMGNSIYGAAHFCGFCRILNRLFYQLGAKNVSGCPLDFSKILCFDYCLQTYIISSEISLEKMESMVHQQQKCDATGNGKYGSHATTGNNYIGAGGATKSILSGAAETCGGGEGEATVARTGVERDDGCGDGESALKTSDGIHDGSTLSKEGEAIPGEDATNSAIGAGIVTGAGIILPDRWPSKMYVEKKAPARVACSIGGCRVYRDDNREYHGLSPHLRATFVSPYHTQEECFRMLRPYEFLVFDSVCLSFARKQEEAASHAYHSFLTRGINLNYLNRSCLHHNHCSTGKLQNYQKHNATENFHFYANAAGHGSSISGSGPSVNVDAATHGNGIPTNNKHGSIVKTAASKPQCLEGGSHLHDINVAPFHGSRFCSLLKWVDARQQLPNSKQPINTLTQMRIVEKENMVKSGRIWRLGISPASHESRLPASVRESGIMILPENQESAVQQILAILRFTGDEPFPPTFEELNQMKAESESLNSNHQDEIITRKDIFVLSLLSKRLGVTNVREALQKIFSLSQVVARRLCPYLCPEHDEMSKNQGDEHRKATWDLVNSVTEAQLARAVRTMAVTKAECTSADNAANFSAGAAPGPEISSGGGTGTCMTRTQHNNRDGSSGQHDGATHDESNQQTTGNAVNVSVLSSLDEFQLGIILKRLLGLRRRRRLFENERYFRWITLLNLDILEPRVYSLVLGCEEGGKGNYSCGHTMPAVSEDGETPEEREILHVVMTGHVPDGACTSFLYRASVGTTFWCKFIRSLDGLLHSVAREEQVAQMKKAMLTHSESLHEPLQPETLLEANSANLSCANNPHSSAAGGNPYSSSGTNANAMIASIPRQRLSLSYVQEKIKKPVLIVCTTGSSACSFLHVVQQIVRYPSDSPYSKVLLFLGMRSRAEFVFRKDFRGLTEQLLQETSSQTQRNDHSTSHNIVRQDTGQYSSASLNKINPTRVQINICYSRERHRGPGEGSGGVSGEASAAVDSDNHPQTCVGNDASASSGNPISADHDHRIGNNDHRGYIHNEQSRENFVSSKRPPNCGNFNDERWPGGSTEGPPNRAGLTQRKIAQQCESPAHHGRIPDSSHNGDRLNRMIDANRMMDSPCRDSDSAISGRCSSADRSSEIGGSDRSGLHTEYSLEASRYSEISRSSSLNTIEQPSRSVCLPSTNCNIVTSARERRRTSSVGGGDGNFVAEEARLNLHEDGESARLQENDGNDSRSSRYGAVSVSPSVVSLGETVPETVPSPIGLRSPQNNCKSLNSHDRIPPENGTSADGGSNNPQAVNVIGSHGGHGSSHLGRMNTNNGKGGPCNTTNNTSTGVTKKPRNPLFVERFAAFDMHDMPGDIFEQFIEQRRINFAEPGGGGASPKALSSNNRAGLSASSQMNGNNSSMPTMAAGHHQRGHRNNRNLTISNATTGVPNLNYHHGVAGGLPSLGGQRRDSTGSRSLQRKDSLNRIKGRRSSTKHRKSFLSLSGSERGGERNMVVLEGEEFDCSEDNCSRLSAEPPQFAEGPVDQFSGEQQLAPSQGAEVDKCQQAQIGSGDFPGHISLCNGVSDSAVCSSPGRVAESTNPRNEGHEVGDSSRFCAPDPVQPLADAMSGVTGHQHPDFLCGDSAKNQVDPCKFNGGSIANAENRNICSPDQQSTTVCEEETPPICHMSPQTVGSHSMSLDSSPSDNYAGGGGGLPPKVDNGPLALAASGAVPASVVAMIGDRIRSVGGFANVTPEMASGLLKIIYSHAGHSCAEAVSNQLCSANNNQNYVLGDVHGGTNLNNMVNFHASDMNPVEDVNVAGPTPAMLPPSMGYSDSPSFPANSGNPESCVTSPAAASSPCFPCHDNNTRFDTVKVFQNAETFVQSHSTQDEPSASLRNVQHQNLASIESPPDLKISESGHAGFSDMGQHMERANSASMLRMETNPGTKSVNIGIKFEEARSEEGGGDLKSRPNMLNSNLNNSNLNNMEEELNDLLSQKRLSVDTRSDRSGDRRRDSDANPHPSGDRRRDSDANPHPSGDRGRDSDTNLLSDQSHENQANLEGRESSGEISRSSSRDLTSSRSSHDGSLARNQGYDSGSHARPDGQPDNYHSAVVNSPDASLPDEHSQPYGSRQAVSTGVCSSSQEIQQSPEIQQPECSSNQHQMYYQEPQYLVAHSVTAVHKQPHHTMEGTATPLHSRTGVQQSDCLVLTRAEQHDGLLPTNCHHPVDSNFPSQQLGVSNNNFSSQQQCSSARRRGDKRGALENRQNERRDSLKINSLHNSRRQQSHNRQNNHSSGATAIKTAGTDLDSLRDRDWLKRKGKQCFRVLDLLQLRKAEIVKMCDQVGRPDPLVWVGGMCDREVRRFFLTECNLRSDRYFHQDRFFLSHPPNKFFDENLTREW